MIIKKYRVVEQQPTETSIFCRFFIDDIEESTGRVVGRTSYGGSKMYFITDLKRNVSQYPIWLNSIQAVKRGLQDLGYNFK